MSEKSLSQEQIQEIVKLSEARCSRPEIAEQVGCSKNTVYRYQNNLGLI